MTATLIVSAPGRRHGNNTGVDFEQCITHRDVCRPHYALHTKLYSKLIQIPTEKTNTYYKLNYRNGGK